MPNLNLQQDIALAPYTTIGIGGPARWYAVAETEEDVAEAVRVARDELNVPLFVFGGGSNLLIADTGFAGLALRIALDGICAETCGDGVLVCAGAGTNWDTLVQYTVDRNLAGMECLAGIPGTTGGTPVQNVGAYGQEVSQTIQAVRCFDRRTSTVVELSNQECGFGYRTSLLNTTERDRYIILRVDFLLRVDGEPTLQFAELKRRFEGKSRPSLSETADAVRAIRRGKGMVVDATDPDSRSAGSFFRNPVVSAAELGHVAAAAGLPEQDVPNWPAAEGRVKLPAAWLLERAGFVRGYTQGNAGISRKHTLALINLGGATADDIVRLRDRIVSTVHQRFGLVLEQEPVSLS